MLELEPGQSTAAIRALFPRSGHVWRRRYAVLNGSCRGRILTDDPDNPTWAAVQEYSDDSVLFLGGVVSRQLAGTLIEIMRRGRTLCFGAPEGDPALELFPLERDYDDFDIDFEDRDPHLDLEPLCKPPPGLRLERIDADLLPRCAWGPWMTAGMETVLDQGLGYCLLDGDMVVSEAFAGPVVDGELEMATITADAWQGRGLATVVSARTVLECERNGWTTWWNTSGRNVASQSISRKIGYRTERQYRLLAWYAT
jgi:hypothetical protein